MFAIKLRTLIIYFLVAVLSVMSAFLMQGFAKESEKSKGSGTELPILMYHAICDTNGKTGKFVITKDEFEEDLKYLKKEGYTAISFAELLDYTEGIGVLPEKPIMLTFDDGYFNNYCYAYPLLKEYNQKAVISIIGRYTDMYSETDEENPKYSHITWEQAREMYRSGLVEIENHSYNSHTNDKGRNGTKKKTGESTEAYAEYILSDIGKLQDEIEENLGYRPMVFAYPFGSISEASYDILENMGFKATLSCEEKVNYINRGDKLFRLGRFLRESGRSAESIAKNFKKGLTEI